MKNPMKMNLREEFNESYSMNIPFSAYQPIKQLLSADYSDDQSGRNEVCVPLGDLYALAMRGNKEALDLFAYGCLSHIRTSYEIEAMFSEAGDDL